MSELTPDQKREITFRLGYQRLPRDDERHDVMGPEGRHRGLFRPSRATDVWVWNDAVHTFELYRDREGAVHRRRPSNPDAIVLEPIWPEPGDAVELAPADLQKRYQRLSVGSQS